MTDSIYYDSSDEEFVEEETHNETHIESNPRSFRGRRNQNPPTSSFSIGEESESEDEEDQETRRQRLRREEIVATQRTFVCMSCPMDSNNAPPAPLLRRSHACLYQENISLPCSMGCGRMVQTTIRY